MSASEAEYSESWIEHDGNVVEISDTLQSFGSHLNAIIEAAEVADLESEIEKFGHEDITFSVRTECDGSNRTLIFELTINNWVEHTGGQSAYSTQDMVEYRCDPSLKEPDELMFANGAFYHKLSNRMSGLFDSTYVSGFSFRLDSYDDETITFRREATITRYDRN